MISGLSVHIWATVLLLTDRIVAMFNCFFTITLCLTLLRRSAESPSTGGAHHALAASQSCAASHQISMDRVIVNRFDPPYVPYVR